MYTSFATLLEQSKTTDKPLWQLIQEEDCGEEAITKEASFEKMREMYRAMKRSRDSYNPKQMSASGLVGDEAAKLHAYHQKHSLVDDFVGEVMENALKVAASNACMHVIVAAPTAGACGVLPAVLLAAQDHFNFNEEDMVKALYVAGGIGGIIAKRASISGAAGGCQAEIGSASAMAAGALVFLHEGTNDMIADASAIALKGLLGLVCDPVCGLVEVPCVKRNVIGAVNAVTSADLALAGITSRIPADQVFDAMGIIGSRMPMEVRETALGGLAATPEAHKIAERLKQQETEK